MRYKSASVNLTFISAVVLIVDKGLPFGEIGEEDIGNVWIGRESKGSILWFWILPLACEIVLLFQIVNSPVSIGHPSFEFALEGACLFHKIDSRKALRDSIHKIPIKD